MSCFGSGMGETEEDFQRKGQGSSWAGFQPGHGMCGYSVGTGKDILGDWNDDPSFSRFECFDICSLFHFVVVE